MFTSSAAIVVMALQQKKLTRYFVRAGAFSPETSVSPKLLPRVGSHSLDELQRQRIVLSTPDGNLYLEGGLLERVNAAETAATRKMMLILISIFAVGLTLFTGLAYLLAVA